MTVRRLARTCPGPGLRIITETCSADAKTEFRRTRSTTNPAHIIGFLSQWQTYVTTIQADPTVRQVKRPLSELLDRMSPEQLGQLYELMQATKEAYEPPLPTTSDDDKSK